jgi:hypothetical protein
MSIRDVRKIYIERMENHLGELIAAEIGQQMPFRLTVVADKADADAVMVGHSAKRTGSRFTAGFRNELTATVAITDKEGVTQLWTSEAGDRQVGVKPGGAKKVAERLVSNLKRALEQ